MAIFLNSRLDNHKDFSIKSRHVIKIDGAEWPTVEHYVEAQRFTCPLLQETVRIAEYAFEAKALARRHPDKLRSDWEDVREQVMEAALRQKFSSYESLSESLIATGAEEIIDATPCSSFWGAGMAGTGLNMFGQLLMKVRQELQQRTGEHQHHHRGELAFGSLIG